MNAEGDDDRPGRFEDQKQLGCDHPVCDEKAVRDTCKHLWACERDKHRVPLDTVHNQLPKDAVDWMPATILAAPKRIKQPRMTVAP